MSDSNDFEPTIIGIAFGNSYTSIGYTNKVSSNREVD